VRTRLTRAEETKQRLDDATFRIHRYFVDSEPAQQMLALLALR